MAFNFNWSPLTADAEFYQRARDLLTTALNKSPKPPIIVDDILVTEFNLGSIPPELEILEIGDLAEDRFRGIFKMCYSGDAFLTLKTRVQANPLNTYESSKPSFTSPRALAASSGLTIPLQITLSDIKLSAFIILVFSKQKGLTLVFRNDPLESLKVSSTFDSIQFVRDYLQRTIEGKLRDLMMEELPAIIHRLSLRLWCPDQLPKEDEEETSDEPVVDPFASPPLDAVDANGNLLDASAISQLSLEGGTEGKALFSQKNLLRLATLTDSNRTLSLFTPSIRDVVFRAWTGPWDRLDTSHSSPLATPSLARSHSFQGNGTGTTYTFSDTAGSEHGPARPTLASFNSASMGLGLGAGRHSRSYIGRKKKKRVVNLRKPKGDGAASSELGDTISDTSSVLGPMSEPIMTGSIPEEPEGPITMSTSKRRFQQGVDKVAPNRPPLNMDLFESMDAVANSSSPVTTLDQVAANDAAAARTAEPAVTTVKEGKQQAAPEPASEKTQARPFGHSRPLSDTSSVILEQAWIMKMASEIARRVYDEKSRNGNFWAEQDDSPPPAYEAS